MKFLTQKSIFLTIFLILHIKNLHANNDEEDDLLDFDFDTVEQDKSSIKNHTKSADLSAENEINHQNESNSDNFPTDSSLQQKLRQREELVKSTIVNTMRNEKIKRNIAQILPILRVMTPTQKLALATLVQKQVLDVRENPGYNLNEVRALFGPKNENASSELLLPISLDVANLFRKARHIDSTQMKGDDLPKSQELKATEKPDDNKIAETEDVETIPEAQELRGIPPYLRRNAIHQKLPGGGPFRRNIIDRGSGPKTSVHRLVPRKPPGGKTGPEIKDNHCDTLVNGICFETSDYPLEPIMLAIRRNKDAMHHLFAEYQDINQTAVENDLNNNRRVSDDSKGLMCETMVKYARPKKAKATSGKWKFVVNTPEHTQTLRIEKCLKPYDTCSYLTDNYKTHCMQVYNYHRLLTWDKHIGLHMDIFKVPTCCSCHVKGYKATYPPETHTSHTQTHPEIFPGHDLLDEPSVDPNLVVNESHFDQALAFGENEHQNHAPRHPVTSYGTPIRGKPVRSSAPHHPPGGQYYRYKKTGIAPPSESDLYDDNYSSNSKVGLSHYLEVPPSKTYATNPFLTRSGSGGAIKRGAGATPPPGVSTRTTSGTSRRPTQLIRQRPQQSQRPQIPVHDLEYESTDIQPSIQTSYPYTPTTVRNGYGNDNTTPESVNKYNTRNIVTKRINYNYHPIIDFFDPINTSDEEAQKRIDVGNDDLMGGWRPVTAPAGLVSANSRRQTV